MLGKTWNDLHRSKYVTMLILFVIIIFMFMQIVVQYEKKTLLCREET